MRQYVALALIILIQFTVANASAAGFAYLLKQSEFQQISQAEQVKYLTTVFQTLAEAEQSKKLKSTCVVAGDVFQKKGNSCTKKQACAKYEVSCAPYLAEQECVNANSKVAPTAQCIATHPINNDTADFFANREAADIFRMIGKGLAEFCGATPKPQSCDSLEQQTKTYRDQLQPKTQKTSLFNLLRLFFTEAYAAAICSYDPQTQKFTGQDGQTIQFHFAIHAGPHSVGVFWDEAAPNANLYEPAQKMIKANAKQNVEMQKHALDMYKKLKNGELNWVGYEGSEKFQKKSGGTVAAMSRMALMEADLQKSGLSANEVQLALIDIYGSDKYAYYMWFKEQSDPEAASDKIKLVGIDNGRNPKVDRLDEKRDKSNNRTMAALKGLSAVPYTPDNTTFSLKFYESLKHNESDINTVEQLLKSPDAAKITPEMKKALNEYRQAYKESYQIDKEYKEASDKEFKVRDFSMAQDTFKALVNNGQGYTTLGSDHEKGTIAYLIQTCKNYRGKYSPDSSGSGSSSGSKSNSSGVDSAN